MSGTTYQVGPAMPPNTIGRADPERLTPFPFPRAASGPSRASPKPLHSRFGNIQPEIDPRLPRFSSITESGNLDLSIEEVTSTKISIDEEAIISPESNSTDDSNERAGKRLRFQHALRKAISMPSLSLKTMKRRFRKYSNATSADGDTSPGTPSHTEDNSTSTPEQTSTTLVESGYGSPARSSSVTLRACQYANVAGNANSGRSTPLSRFDGRENLMPGRTDASQSTISLGPPTARSSTYALGQSNVSLGSYPTAHDRYLRHSGFLGRAHMQTNDPDMLSPRSASLGSIGELQTHSYAFAQRRALSRPRTPSRRPASAHGRNASSLSVPPRPVTVAEVGSLQDLRQLRREPLYVPMQDSSRATYRIPPSTEVPRPIAAPHRLLSSKANSYRSLQQQSSTPLIVRSPEINEILEKEKYGEKVPVFVPKEIIKPPAFRPVIPARSASLPASTQPLQKSDAIQEVPATMVGAISREALSEGSASSTAAQTDAKFHAKDQLELDMEDETVGDSQKTWWGKLYRAIVKLRLRASGRPLAEYFAHGKIGDPIESQDHEEKQGLMAPGRSLIRVFNQKIFGSRSSGTEATSGDKSTAGLETGPPPAGEAHAPNDAATTPNQEATNFNDTPAEREEGSAN